MATNTNPLRMRVDNVRIDWPELFVGKQYNGTGAYRCGLTFIIPPNHPQFAAIENAIKLAAKEKWKDKAQAKYEAAKMKDNICLRDGRLKADKSDGYEGNFYVSASCKGADEEAQCVKPTVYDAARNVVTNPAQNPIYRGCYGNVLVEFYAMDQYGDQINCKLIGVQFARDGDAFGSAPARPDDFEDVSAGANADDFAPQGMGTDGAPW